MNRFFATYFGNLALFTVTIILILIGPFGAEAQEVLCAPTDLIEQELESTHGETLRASREANVPGGTAQLWTNGATGTYSVLTNPEPGLTCLIDAGQDDRLKELEV